MPMLTIRPALPSDAVALQALARAIWNAVYPSIITQAQIDFMLEQMYNPAQIATEMDTGYRWKWVELDGVAIGFISTLIENGDTLKVSKIYLDPSHHGKGFGQEVLNHIEASARRAGATSIYLFVNRSNQRAVKAYQRARYEIVATLDQPFGSFVLNDFKMQKRLS